MEVPMDRLSKPLEYMKGHYSVVVVGSGYGGSITACRAARAGQSVCVLERGKEMLPGEFPDNAWEGVHEIQALSTSGRHVGSPTALFDFRLNDDINVLVGCGLGGTSLINANVALRPGDYAFDGRWPRELSGSDCQALDEGYRLAEEMLKPVPYPASLPRPPKLAALEEAAERTDQGAFFTRPPITVTFTDGPNHAGVEQRACVLCGDCCSGCNFAAKNTTLMTYLPDAARHGAEIFTTVSVRTVHREAGRWVVRYHRAVGAGPGDAEEFVTADVVVLAAGTMGSTEILLRSRQECGLAVSHRLGCRFSGNGDVIGFGYDTDRAVNGVGRGSRQTVADAAVGPCITGMIDRRDRRELADRLIVQDAAIPGLLGRLLPLAFLLTEEAEEGEEEEDRPVKRGLAKAWRKLASVPFGPYHGPVSRSATYLVMSGDDDHGQMRLRGDHVGVDWPGVGGRPVFARDNSDLAELARSLDGTYLANPLWFGGRDLITVHPLGGCAMADGAEAGVVNHKGQVFAGARGESVHDGLYVADGSIVPAPLGVNPFLTIAALAERNAALLAHDRGWRVAPDAYPPTPVDGRPEPQAPRPGIRFRETLRGFMSREGDTFEAAYRRGRVDASTFVYHLTIASDDLPALLADPAHGASVSGTVAAPALSPKDLQVRGTFQLFDDDPTKVETKRMWYRLVLTAEDGRVYDFVGYKLIHGQGVKDMWSDTTTLFFTVSERGGDARVARGILRLGVIDFIRLLRTIEITSTARATDRVRYLQDFLRVFLGVLWHTYAGVLDLDHDFRPLEEPPARRLRAPDPERHEVATRDGARILLTRYRGGPKGPVLLAPGFGVTADSFAAVTVDENLVECLTAQSYDVWLFDYRASPLLVSDVDRRSANFSIDDVAGYDWPGAVDHVRQVTGAPTVQAVAHCVGSMSFLMAMTEGLEGVRSAVCSQLTVDAPTNVVSHLKASLRVADIFQLIGLRVLDTDAPPTRLDKALDVVLRLNPVLKGERCHSPVCRRIFGIFGPSYKHDQLNEATHRAIHEWFGHSSDIAFKQLATIVRKKVAVDRHGLDRYLPKLDRVRIPILFLAGEDNEEFFPSASALTIRRLQKVNDPGLYTRTVLPGYGHMDCFIGRTAARDVFPAIVEHLEAHPSGVG
jgi:cholesterol oxidase